MTTKICTKCKKEKELSKFSKQQKGKFGVRTLCKECQNKYFKNYYINNEKKLIKNKKDWYINNKNKVKIYNIKYHKIYYKQNKKEIKNQQKQYRDKNKKQILRYNINYEKNKIKNNISFKVLKNIRRRINLALQGKNKSLSTMFLIGCEIDYLMFHIQNQFKDGMSWDNYGLWHIDHIKPCALFDLSKESEQRKCFNYTNLQPLWAIDNLKKGSKYEA